MHRRLITAFTMKHACVRNLAFYYFNYTYTEGIWHGKGSIHQNEELVNVIDQEAQSPPIADEV